MARRKKISIAGEERNVQSGDCYTLILKQQLGCDCVKELQFDAIRKWRFDYAIPEHRIAIEIDGGVWLEGGGRHNRASGWIKDQEKLNAAAAQGWRVLHLTPQQQYSNYALETIKSAMRYKSMSAEEIFTNNLLIL